METKHHFRSYDGTELEGTLVVGNGSRDALVLMVHGITSSRDEFGLFSDFAKHLARVGTSSFRFDYRCHGVNEEHMEFMTLSGIVNDIEAAAKCALEQAGASSIHIVGMSFGGGLSAFWAATTKNTVSSVVMLAPVIDYEEDIIGQYGLLVDDRLDERAQHMLQENGCLETGGVCYGSALVNELRYISGIEGLRRLKCESLIIHGDADTVVPYESSERFVKLNAQSRLVNIPGTDHGFSVGDDEDLSSPETKAKHKEVFGIISEFYERVSKYA